MREEGRIKFISQAASHNATVNADKKNPQRLSPPSTMTISIYANVQLPEITVLPSFLDRRKPRHLMSAFAISHDDRHDSPTFLANVW